MERPDDLLGDTGLKKELKIRLMERMLGAELSAHPIYEERNEAAQDQENLLSGSMTRVLKGQDGLFGTKPLMSEVLLPRDGFIPLPL